MKPKINFQKYFFQKTSNEGTNGLGFIITYWTVDKPLLCPTVNGFTAMPPTSLKTHVKKKFVYFFSLNFSLAKLCLQTCQYFSPKDPLGKLLLRTYPLRYQPTPLPAAQCSISPIFFPSISNGVNKICRDHRGNLERTCVKMQKCFLGFIYRDENSSISNIVGPEIDFKSC